MTTLPSKAKVVIIGGGIHGLSTAWKLSETYKNPGDIVVLEKKDTAAGASGIACGVVRNNYFQPAMRELMAHSVEMWEKDAEDFNYHSVGFMQNRRYTFSLPIAKHIFHIVKTFFFAFYKFRIITNFLLLFVN